MNLHFHDLEGGGIAEDKRMINAKSPWTLAHMDMKILQGFYNNPAVPPSMKTKLKGAMMMKPSLKKKKLSGGLAGVSKASGFIQRMMAENKKKHSGQYRKPTSPAHKDSTMSQWKAFDYKKLANAEQGGEGEADYGASPFIQKYFKDGVVPFTKGNTAKESQKQKEARLTMMAKRLAKLAKKLAREQPQNQAVQEQVQEAREAVEEKREEPARVETPAELLEHFGNVAMATEPPVGLEVKPKEKSAEEATPADPAPKPKKKKRVFVDADTGEVLHDERNVVVATPEPPKKIEWTEEELKTNNLTRGDYEDYAEKDERDMSLFLFALNHPKAKLAEAIKYLKDNSIGRGFSPSTVSPLYKKARNDADKVLADEEKQNKTLSNPAYIAIKEKLSSLLKAKKNKPRQTILNAFKGIQAEKYLDAYKKFMDEIGGDREDYKIVDGEQLRHRGGGEWVMYHKNKALADGKKWATGIDPTVEKLENGEYSHKYGEATHWQTWEKQLEVKDAKGDEVKVGKTLVIGSMWEDGKTFTKKVWVVSSNNIPLYVPSSAFPKPEETPYERIHNINEGNSGRFPRYIKPDCRVFYPRELYEHNEAINIGRQLNYWLNTPHKGEDPERDRKYNIGTARILNREAKALEARKYDYLTTVNGVEYICPLASVSDGMYDLQPEETPEERGKLEKPVEPKPMPKKGEYTEANAGDALGKFDEEDETTYFDSLSPNEKKVALWHLNNTLQYSMSSPEIPEGRAKASEIRKEVEILFKRRAEEVKEYKKKKMEYDYSRAKSKKTGSGIPRMCGV